MWLFSLKLLHFFFFLRILILTAILEISKYFYSFMEEKPGKRITQSHTN